MSRRRTFRALTWLLAICATFAGFSNLLRVQPIADDLATFSVGIGYMWDQWQFIEYTSQLLNTLTDGNHFLPVGSLATSTYVTLATLLGNTPLGLANSWNILRIVMIIVAILSATFFVRSWLHGLARDSRIGSLSALAIFALTSSSTIATIQLHALWSNDPVVSYPLAGWGTVAIGFAYLGLLPRFATMRGSRLIFGTLGAGLIAVAGLLHYEMMIAAVVCGAILFVPVFWRLSTPHRRWLRFATAYSGAVLLPLSVFLLVQLWRFTQPRDYNGTSLGYAALVLPVLKNGILSTLPLAGNQLSREFGGGFQFSASWFALTFLGLVLLMVIAARDGRALSKLSTGSSATFAISMVAATLIFLTISSVAIFATSNKYQVEIGQTLGHVYLNYAFGVICISASIALIALVSISFIGVRALVPFSVLLALIFFVTYTGSEGQFRKLEEQRRWVSSLLEAVEEPSSNADRCKLLEPLYAPEVPDWYRNSVIDGMTRASFASTGKPFCESLRAS